MLRRSDLTKWIRCVHQELCNGVTMYTPCSLPGQQHCVRWKHQTLSNELGLAGSEGLKGSPPGGDASCTASCSSDGSWTLRSCRPITSGSFSSPSNGVASPTSAFIDGIETARLPRMGEAYVDTIILYSQEVSRWFEEDLVSEVVFWFDVAHVHHHSRLPIPL